MAKLMRVLSITVATMITASACATQASETDRGTLVIVGGGLDSRTADVWTGFLDAARADGPIVIVPSASGAPAQSAGNASKTFSEYGVAAERIVVAELAMMDDPSTEDVDEADWSANAETAAMADLLRSSAAIWFTGGDQSRTTAILQPDGRSTAALRAIREAFANGAVLGGTSAGAAIMSDPMILQGDSLSVLLGETTGEPLELGSGLGIFEHGLVDQHFGERARLGRLAAALLRQDRHESGFGIDEDTALIVRPDGTAHVAGNGYVSILGKGRGTPDTPVSVTGQILHLVSAGDSIDLSSLAITPAEWKKPTVGNEYVETARIGGMGLAAPPEILPDVLGEALLDNAESRTVTRVSADMTTGRATRFTFGQSDESLGFWGRHPDSGLGRYTIRNVLFDIQPLHLSEALPQVE